MPSLFYLFNVVLTLLLISCSSKRDLVAFPTLSPICEETAGCAQPTPERPERNITSSESLESATISLVCKSQKFTQSCGTQWVTIANSRGQILWRQRGPQLKIPLKSSMDLKLFLDSKSKPLSLSKVKPGDIRAVEIR